LKVRILLVEDDEHIGDGVCAGLALAGHAVDWVADCRSAEEAERLGVYGLIVLDLNFPDGDGPGWLRAVRARGSDVPVLLLTARDTLADKVAGLDSGADDYLVKPFELEELCARIRALERRRSGHPEPLVQYAGIILYPAMQTVRRDGAEVSLSRREYAILRRLLDARGKAISRSALEDQLYAWGEEIASNAIEVHIHHLRKKIGEDVIRTVRGVGYLIVDGV
jgi:DNA-binding response OmpR family regulator